MHRAARHVTIDIVFKENTQLLTNTQDSVASHHFHNLINNYGIMNVSVNA